MSGDDGNVSGFGGDIAVYPTCGGGLEKVSSYK